MPKHFALTLGAVRIEESSVNATRLAGERVGHQRNDGADALMPAERVGQVIKQSDVQQFPFSSASARAPIDGALVI